MDASKIKEKIGRANAGKTTILQRVCNTQENPEIYNSAGKKCGEHNIENEMVFQSNPGFVFHDSCRFEAGGESEFDKAKAFIMGHSKEIKIKDQLHAIWYCIPMDEESRSFTKGEIKFFSQCDTGSIPVIVLFTKFDALYDIAYAQLKLKGVLMEEAEEKAPKHAEETFDTLQNAMYASLYDADCGPLIECTAGTLDDEVVKQLFISTQQSNLELCMEHALNK
ncbi:GTP-binding protein [Suillus subluteus]|nr:GTP-binding protein [Suillus subluteus]